MERCTSLIALVHSCTLKHLFKYKSNLLIDDTINIRLINLIEVMGLAVLPARLKGEMAELRDAILTGKDLHSTETLASHADWALKFTASINFWNAARPSSVHLYTPAHSSTSLNTSPISSLMIPSILDSSILSYLDINLTRFCFLQFMQAEDECRHQEGICENPCEWACKAGGRKAEYQYKYKSDE